MPKPRILNEIKEILTFLRSLWGILAAFSAVFPVANSIRNVIPLEAYLLPAFVPGGPLLNAQPMSAFMLASPALRTELATVCSLFALLLAVSLRHSPMFPNYARPLAIIFAASAVAGLSGYLLIFAGYRVSGSIPLDTYTGPFAVVARFLGVGRPSPQSEIFLMLGYVTFFAGMTAAFTTLGILEYVIDQRRQR